ncbi:hypothetical protein BKM03_27310 [Pseudomonas avellanae]|uniref:Uncharacterized protein n=1 Tax=Pseudomonas avellanae TaxID=46257 RepID=A0AAD0GSL7_9PSED|nr:hypothetical protein BKM03_27310 [Pseudomonas avellanae]POP87513.1 hypothetical protein CXB34_06625 [Pseudomonas amygdali pv. morsprunorum]
MIIVPMLRVGMPFRTLCVPFATQSVEKCIPTRSVGTIINAQAVRVRPRPCPPLADAVRRSVP